MNTENLHILIQKYEDDIDRNMNTAPGKRHEQMKWEAVKEFRDIWFSNASKDKPIAERLRLALGHNATFLNNNAGWVYPIPDIIRLSEVEPEAIEKLFQNVLFSDDGGDLTKRQEHIFQFIDETNRIRKLHFESSKGYKQNLQSISYYLSFYAPDKNFIYRPSDANIMAKVIEYDRYLGSGRSFNLLAYYDMCEIIVQALKEHPSLIEKVNAKLDERCYHDDSLHLMAYDLMYCSQCNKYTVGMTYLPATIQKVVRKKTNSQKQADQRIQEKNKLIQFYLDEAEDAEEQLRDIECMSVIGMEVLSPVDGKGIVTGQVGNKVTVQYANRSAQYRIDENYAVYKWFVGVDAAVLSTLTAWGECDDRLAKANLKLKELGYVQN